MKQTPVYKKIIPHSFLLLGCLLPTTSFSDVDNSFLMNEIALRTTNSGLSNTRKSSIVDLLQNSSSDFEKATKTGVKDDEGYIKRGKIRDLSGEESRINAIASTGVYKKKADTQVVAKPPVLKKSLPVVTKSSQSKKVTQVAKPKLATKSIKTAPAIKTSLAKPKKKSRIRFCAGGSYQALAKKAKKYDKSITKYSKKYGVSKALIKAVITAESCFNHRALSPKGAQGLMQLMPPTAKRFGVSDSYNPDSNIKGGTAYLRFLLKYFKNDMVRVIAAYNAGEGAVRKYKGVPPYRETKNYVRKVAMLYSLYDSGKGELSSQALRASLKKLNIPLSPEEIRRIIFVPRAMPSSRFSPYKNRQRNISRGNCANKTSSRLRKSTHVEGGDGIWQRIYNAKAGETLTQVMRKTGIHKLKIAQMNGLRTRTKLKMGQRLLVWECRK